MCGFVLYRGLNIDMPPASKLLHMMLQFITDEPAEEEKVPKPFAAEGRWDVTDTGTNTQAGICGGINNEEG